MPIFNGFISDTLEIVQNGTYDVTSYTKAIVNTPCNVTSLIISPSKTAQDITPPTGIDGYNQITVNPVTSSIDSNIRPEYIKKGITILGVTGTYGDTVIDNTNINEYITPVITGSDYWYTSNNMITIHYTEATSWETSKSINLKNIINGTANVTVRCYVSSENNYDWGYMIIGTSAVTPTASQVKNSTLPTGGNQYVFRQSGESNTMDSYTFSVNTVSNPILSIGWAQDSSVSKGTNTFYIKDITIK